MYDLNKLASHGSGTAVTLPLNINDRGEIATGGLLQNDLLQAFILIPKTKQ
jgi:hypothetical protein